MEHVTSAGKGRPARRGRDATDGLRRNDFSDLGKTAVDRDGLRCRTVAVLAVFGDDDWVGLGRGRLRRASDVRSLGLCNDA